MLSLPIELTRELRKYAHSVRHLFEINLDSKVLRFTDSDKPLYVSPNWWEPTGIEFDHVSYEMLPSVDKVTLTIDNAGKKLSTRILTENETRGKVVRLYLVVLDLHLSSLGTTLLFYGYSDRAKLNRNKVQLEVYNHMIKWKTMTPRRTHTPTCYRGFQDPTTCGDVPTGEVSTTVKVQWAATDVTGDVIATAGMNLVDTKISIVLDDGTIHWSKLISIDDADTITIADGIPAGRHADVGATVTTYAWCDHSYERCAQMSNSDNFGGFRWLPFLQDKILWWGRGPKS